MKMPDSLDRDLASWCVEPKRDVRFRASVVEAIGREASLSLGSYLRAHAALAAGASALVVVSGGWAGHLQGQRQTHRDREMLAQAYLGSIDARLKSDDAPAGHTH